jgi:mRNA interferase MazF
VVKRGDLYLVHKGNKADPRDYRVFVLVSRQAVIDSQFSTVTCAPVYSRWDELSSQVPLGVESGLKHDSAIHCDELISLPKTMLTNCVGSLNENLVQELNKALLITLEIEE